MGLIRAKLLTPISTNERQVKHQKHLYFLFSFLLRMCKPVFRLKSPLRPYECLLSDWSRGFVKVNLSSSMNSFRAGTRAKDIKLKQRTPSLIGKKKKKKKKPESFYHNKKNLNKFFALIST